MRLFCAALLLAMTTAHGAVQLQRLSFDNSDAAQPSVAVDPSEGFVVTWQVRSAESHQLHFAVIAADGRELRRGLIASGHNWFINSADFPSLVVLDNGDWQTFWLQKTASGTYAYEIRTVRSRDGGRSWDAPIVVHRDATSTEHGFVSMSPAGGDLVQLAWLDGRRMADSKASHEGAAERMTLRTARLGRSGQLSAELQLDELSCSCCQTDMARGLTRTLLAYRDRSSAELRDIGLLLQTAGRWSKSRRVHADNWTIAGCPVNGPAVAARGDRFAVLWPTMAKGDMTIKISTGDGSTHEWPKVLAEGAAELGRVDLATWGRDDFLATRVRQGAGQTELVLDQLDSRGSSSHSMVVATGVGGYPRMARMGEVALLAWAESGGQSGTRVALSRISAAAP